MGKVIKNSIRIFTRNKDFIAMMIVVPVVIFLLMTALLPYSETHSIAVINKTSDTTIENALRSIDGIDVQDIDEDDTAEQIAGGNIDLAVIIDEQNGTVYTQVITAGESEITNAVRLAIRKASETADNGFSVTVNEDSRGSRNMGTASSFMIYKFLQGGSLLGVYIIMERQRRMKDRIMLSGIKSGTYIGGMSLVFLAGTMIGSVIYYLTAVILDFDFGMKNSLYYLIMLFISNIFGVAFSVFVAAITNSEAANNNLSMAVLTALGFFSGILFPYEYMPDIFKAVGMLSPQRWISSAIERICATGELSSALPEIVLTLVVSLVLYTIGAWCCGKKLAK